MELSRNMQSENTPNLGSTILSILQNEKYKGSAPLQKSFTTVFLTRNSKNKELDAFVYIMHEERKLGVPTTSYIRTCEKATASSDLTLSFLTRLTIKVKSGRRNEKRHKHRANLPEMRTGIHCTPSNFPNG